MVQAQILQMIEIHIKFLSEAFLSATAEVSREYG